MGKHQTGKLVGLSGNVLVKSNISKSKFDNVFDIREDLSLHIQNMRKIHLLGFSIQRLWEKSLETSRNFSIGPLFSQFDRWVPMTWGLNPYFIWGSKNFFLVVIHLFGITKCSKWLDLSGNTGNTTYNEYIGRDHVFQPQEEIYETPAPP